MPTSVRENILANIQTTLEAVAAGANYNYTIRRVTRSPLIVPDEVVTPTVYFTASDSAASPLEGGGSSTGLTMWTMAVEIIGIVEKTMPPHDTAANNLVHDIIRALAADRYRGTYAINTAFTGIRTDSTEGYEAFCTCQVSVTITYRHDYTNPAQQR